MTPVEKKAYEVENARSMLQNKDVPAAAQNNAGHLEEEHVHSVYSAIAGHFSSTRYKPWPRIAGYLEALAPGSVVLDVGCGNGKYLGVNKEVMMLGLERCPELCDICNSRGFVDVATGDGLLIPVRTGAADAVISIAVVHHHATDERRMAALAEMCRCLRTGGTMLVYCWALEQSKRKFDQQDVFIPWTLQPSFDGKAAAKCEPLTAEQKAAKGRAKAAAKKAAKKAAKEAKKRGEEPVTEEEQGPRVVEVAAAAAEDQQPGAEAEAARPEGTVFNRYYHMFKEGELEKLVAGVSQLQLVESYYDHENWVVIAKKIAD